MSEKPRVKMPEFVLPYVASDGRRYELACADVETYPGDAVAVGTPERWLLGRLYAATDRWLGLTEATSGARVVVPRTYTDGVAWVWGARRV